MTTQVTSETVPIYLAGEFVRAGTPLEVRDPATGDLVATTWQAGPEELEQATVAAVAAFDKTRRLASFERRDALAHLQVPEDLYRERSYRLPNATQVVQSTHTAPPPHAN